jgi:pullulanase/glycogen debranching enzyme
LSLAATALAQTPAFWHAGSDLLRSKSLDRNSYDSGDWFNTLDWTGADNGFGHGLPPKTDNEAKWPFMKPLLANPALKPSAADVASASAAATDLLKLRFSTPLFRLGSADLIKQKLSYPLSGTSAAKPGVVVLRIDDTVGPDVDPALKGVVVVFNSTSEAVTHQLPGLSGADLSLSPVQAAGSDPIVKQTTWTAAGGTVTVPARTAAVLVQR